MPDPISRRGYVIPVFVIAAAALLLAASGYVAYRTQQTYAWEEQNALEVTARILASTVTAALAFDDHDAAQEYVYALRNNPRIAAAALYDDENRLVADFSREGRTVPELAPAQGLQRPSGSIAITVPVIQDGLELGSVYILGAPESLTARLSRYAGVMALAAMAILLFGVMGIAQTALARVNRALNRRAAELTRVNQELQSQIEEREKAEAALRQVQKMETIGQLTGGVAHDFNNLLAVIVGNLDRVQRLVDRNGETSRILRAAGNAMQGAQKAASLTSSLLAFSRRQPLEPKPTNVNRLVSNMSELLRQTLGETVKIETVLAGGLWRARVDANQLDSALLNLAVNARDAMPEGGRLTLETANAYLDERYADSHGEATPGQYVLISVTDSGEGMSPETKERVFEPFFTTKGASQGTGLGLSQVYGFVKQSGGNVDIYSELGIGTTVKIYLPRLTGADTGDERDAFAQAVGATQGETVLAVEDDPGVRANTVETLEELGYRVYEAEDGVTAQEILDRVPEIVLLFTDVGLAGGMNGRQLADAAQEKRPSLKVLFTTGYARNAIVHEGELDAGLHLLTKPFTRGELAAAIRRVLDVV